MKPDADKLVELLIDIILSSDANDGDSLANAINSAKDYLRDFDLPVYLQEGLR